MKLAGYESMILVHKWSVKLAGNESVILVHKWSVKLSCKLSLKLVHEKLDKKTTNAIIIISFKIYNPNILFISKIEFAFALE